MEENNINYYQIPKEGAMDEVKLEFEETEPKEVREVDPTTMGKIEKFQDKNRLYFRSLGKNILSVYKNEKEAV